jgi:hypothetical protein
MISVDRTEPAPSEEPGRTHLRWVTLALLAVVIAFVDGFWTTSLRGAVGAIEQTQEPFESWVRSSELTLPFYVLAVVVAAVIARRWVGTGRRNPLKPVAVALLVVVTTTLVGVGAIAVNAVNDYHLQSEKLAVVHARHTTAAGSVHDPAEHADHAAADEGCDALCQAQHSTLAAHERGVAYGGIALLLTNALLIGFLVVLWDVRLWTRHTPTAAGNGAARVRSASLLRHRPAERHRCGRDARHLRPHSGRITTSPRP